VCFLGQRIFGDAEIRWVCRGAVQVRIFLLFFLFLDLTFNLGKIGNKKIFGGTEEMLWGAGEAPLVFNIGTFVFCLYWGVVWSLVHVKKMISNKLRKGQCRKE